MRVSAVLGLLAIGLLGDTGMQTADALLAVHRSYAASVFPVLGSIHGLAHITGGGIGGNLVRVLPEGVQAFIDPHSWELPPLFELLQQAGRVDDAEMREVFLEEAREVMDNAHAALAALADVADDLGELTTVRRASSEARRSAQADSVARRRRPHRSSSKERSTVPSG